MNTRYNLCLNTFVEYCCLHTLHLYKFESMKYINLIGKPSMPICNVNRDNHVLQALKLILRYWSANNLKLSNLTDTCGLLGAYRTAKILWILMMYTGLTENMVTSCFKCFFLCRLPAFITDNLHIQYVVVGGYTGILNSRRLKYGNAFSVSSYDAAIIYCLSYSEVIVCLSPNASLGFAVLHSTNFPMI